MVEAGHPVPDAAGLAGARRRRSQIADAATARRSGAGAALGRRVGQLDRAGATGLSFADKQTVTRALLRSGANIGEMNTRAKASLPHQGRAAGRSVRIPRGC